MLVEGGVQGQRLAITDVGAQLLAEAPLVVGDQRVGGIEDVRRGAIVLLQTDDLGIGEIAVELLDVLDLRAAPAIDRLIVVAHHHQALAALGEKAQPGVLHGVGVLELVDQDMAEATLVMLQQAGIVAPQVEGTQQQLGEVDDAGACAGRLVGFINAAHGGQEQVAAGLDALRADALILLPVNEPLRLLGRPALFIQAEVADYPLDQALLIVRVENLEVLGQPRFFPVRTQQAVSQAVEGADPHAGRGVAQHVFDTVAHLGGRLVGEGHRQDAVWRDVQALDQEGDAVYQHTGLARAGTGQHQLMTRRRGDRVVLGGIEGGESVIEVILHRGILGGRTGEGKPSARRGETSLTQPTTGRSGRRWAWPGGQRPSRSAGARQKMGAKP